MAHLSVARVAEALAVSWHTANTAVLAEGHRVLIDDPTRFDDVRVIGVDEHVWRHTRRGDKYVTVIIDLLPKHEDRRVLRWGGLAGILGGVLLIVTFVIVGALVGIFAGPEAEVAAYPDVQVARTFENGLYLLAPVSYTHLTLPTKRIV